MSKDFSIIPDWLTRLAPARSPRWGLVVLWVGLSLGVVWLGSGLLAALVAESLWFSNLGYLDLFWTRILTQICAWIIPTGLSLAVMVANFRWVQRWQHPKPAPAATPTSVNDQRRLLALGMPMVTVTPGRSLSRPLTFRWLLLFAGGISLVTSLVLLYYGQAVLRLWQMAANQTDVLPAIPAALRIDSLWTLAQQLWSWQNPLIPVIGMSVWIGGAIAILVYPRFLLTSLGLLLSLGFGSVWAANWSPLLLFWRRQFFHQTDPLFGHDISFYLLALPIWQLLEFWLLGLVLYLLLATLLLYLLSGNSLSRGNFPGFSIPQQWHLFGLMSGFMAIVGLSYWLRRYELLYSPHGVVFGAAYTEVHVQLPFYTGLAGAAIAIALFLGWQARPHGRSPLLDPNLPRRFRKISWSLLLLALFCALEVLSTTLLPLAVQRFVVQPNELTQELPYIRQNIAFTRQAFKLENITVEPFNPQDSLTLEDLRRNDPTIRNIRLWDTRPLLETNRQLQQIRPYYRFFDADIDRYNLIDQPLPASSPTPGAVNPEAIKQQVLISARELDFAAVPSDAQTWVNEHLVYTHGYGFTISPVNKVAPGGLPDYFVKDIGVGTQAGGDAAKGNLTTANAGIRASIPIGEPRIYFGELTNTYVMTNTAVEELDFPSGNENIYNVYDGKGGVQMGTGWRRLAFARYLKDWRMLLTNSFKADTQVIYRRNLKERVQAIAPFLHYDQDPYLVTADIGCLGLNFGCDPAQIKPDAPTRNYLYWILDAYTVSGLYPYSEPSALWGNNLEAPAGDRFSYIRNSVKVVIDAYNGAVNFYVADPTDPIIQSWGRVFPKLLRPIEQLPASLRSHIRYPLDLFSIQSERLMTYHMTDPQVFYNQEDQWQIPNEIYGTEARPVEPYFLITNLPTKVELEEFILLLPFKPTQRTNLIAWLAARSDANNYGKQLLYVFPKQQLVFGIEQIEARINQDPVISQQITLWNRQGSRVLQGNLLVIPIEQSLLYVEPLYLEAEQNSLPTLVSVVVAYKNRIAMADTLEKALDAIFQPPTMTTPAIVRPVE